MENCYLPRFPDATDRDIPHATRDEVFGRDDNACQYCGEVAATTIDHVFPWANGGSHDPHNLVVACRVCNSIAGLRVFPEFAAKKEYVLARREQLGPHRLSLIEKILNEGRRLPSHLV